MIKTPFTTVEPGTAIPEHCGCWMVRGADMQRYREICDHFEPGNAFVTHKSQPANTHALCMYCEHPQICHQRKDAVFGGADGAPDA